MSRCGHNRDSKTCPWCVLLRANQGHNRLERRVSRLEAGLGFMAVVVLLLVAALLATSGCTARTHRVTIPAAAIADLATTEMAIHRGLVEVNPFPWAQTTERRVAVSIAWVAASIWVLESLHDAGHPGWARVLEVFLVVLKALPAAWNIGEMRGKGTR